MKNNAKTSIKDRQREWAKAAGIPIDTSGYCERPEANLPWLSTAICKQLDAGDGGELGAPGKVGKICAVHSSSALGVNFFGYWQMRKRGPLEKALNLTSPIAAVAFERKFPTGLRGLSPNMDITLEQADGSLLAIESKFTEWQGTSGQKALRDAYLPPGRKLWAALGLPDVQEVAETYRDAPGFTRLDVPQLLKHMLGLANQSAAWELMLLWYDEPGVAGTEMGLEIARFRQMLGVDAGRFSAMTYQDLWALLRPELSPHDTAYREYLDGRYFSGTPPIEMYTDERIKEFEDMSRPPKSQ